MLFAVLLLLFFEGGEGEGEFERRRQSRAVTEAAAASRGATLEATLEGRMRKAERVADLICRYSAAVCVFVVVRLIVACGISTPSRPQKQSKMASRFEEEERVRRTCGELLLPLLFYASDGKSLCAGTV